jgi:hypothetical protein
LKIDEEVQKLAGRLNFWLHNVKNLNIGKMIKDAELYLLSRTKENASLYNSHTQHA